MLFEINAKNPTNGGEVAYPKSRWLQNEKYNNSSRWYSKLNPENKCRPVLTAPIKAMKKKPDLLFI